MMLAPHVPFDPEESPLSYAARLAGIHTGGRLIPFLRDLEFEPEDMVSNKEEALSPLAICTPTLRCRSGGGPMFSVVSWSPRSS